MFSKSFNTVVNRSASAFTGLVVSERFDGDGCAQIRREPRFRIRKYVHSQLRGYPISGQVINFSQLGVMLRCNEPLDLAASAVTKQSSLQMSLSFPGHDSDQRVVMSATPVWCAKSLLSNKYDLGLEWGSLSPARKLLLNFWQTYWID